MKKIVILISILMCGLAANAQFILGGKIAYERKVNLHAQMEEMEDNEWFARIKAQLPKFMNSNFDMIFDSTHISYKPGKEIEGQAKSPFGEGPATSNIVYTDLGAGNVKSAKTVYEQKYLVQDSLRKLAWKEKDEIRIIAGYKCHKAVSIICDTVYVVAFYAEDIPVSGGPEMFSGLPGMILELAVPRLHTTWVATKVEAKTPLATDFVIPDKGKKITQKELNTSIKESFKAWGSMASRNVWWVAL